MFTVRLLIAGALLTATFAAPAGAGHAGGCTSGYAYVGAESPIQGYGVSATLETLAETAIASGHVAAWLGVGGPGLGPGGTDSWLQAGIAQDAGGDDVVYYEFKRPGDTAATYVPLEHAGQGEKHTFVVYERAGQRDSWRVMIDGLKVGDPVTLPGSHGTFRPLAMAENWDGGVAGTCNRYDFDFSNLAVRRQYAGAWSAFDLSRILHDPTYDLTLRSSGFLAASY